MSSNVVSIGNLPEDQLVKNPPAMLETQVRSLGWEGGISFLRVGGNGSPLQYFYLENPMDRGAWEMTVHGVAESCKETRLK